jgi:hypothetical protein
MKTLQRRISFIQPYNLGSFLVSSQSREGEHLVDFTGSEEERVVCTCESFIMGKARPCRHIRLLVETFGREKILNLMSA